MALKEDYLQYKLCDWMRDKKIMHFHVPNGGNRSSREAAKFKAMGVKAGVHDLIIMHGGKIIFVELKTDKGKVSKPQIAFDEFVKKEGHPSHLLLAHSVEDGLEQLQSILHENGLQF